MPLELPACVPAYRGRFDPPRQNQGGEEARADPDKHAPIFGPHPARWASSRPRLSRVPGLMRNPPNRAGFGFLGTKRGGQTLWSGSLPARSDLFALPSPRGRAVRARLRSGWRPVQHRTRQDGSASPWAPRTRCPGPSPHGENGGRAIEGSPPHLDTTPIRAYRLTVRSAVAQHRDRTSCWRPHAHRRAPSRSRTPVPESSRRVTAGHDVVPSTTLLSSPLPNGRQVQAAREEGMRGVPSCHNSRAGP